MTFAPLAVSPAGGATRDTASSVNLLSLSEATSNLELDDTVELNGFVIGALAWWRFESFTEGEVQVYFDAMRSANLDGSECEATIVLFDDTGKALLVSYSGDDPVDGGVRRGAALSPQMQLGDVLYIAVGQDNDGLTDAAYRLRVSDHSPLTDWIDLPDRDRTSVSDVHSIGNDAPAFDPDAEVFVPDPEMPYVPPYVYNAGFVQSASVWNGGAGVQDLYSLSNRVPPLPGYDGGGPYDSIFQGGAASDCAQLAASHSGKWNTEGAQWGAYWRNYCPPPLETNGDVVSLGSGSHDVYLRVDVAHPDLAVLGVDAPTSLHFGYRAPYVAFNLHAAQEVLGPSGGWLIQEEMRDQRTAETGVTSDIVWEKDRCDILDVVVVRKEATTAALGFDTIAPNDSGPRIAPAATWRGGVSRVPKPAELKWGPYVEEGQVFDDGQVIYDVTMYGSSAGPESVQVLGPVLFDRNHLNPAQGVFDWQDAYDFEEARKYTIDDGFGHLEDRYDAPGLVYIATGDGYSQFAVDFAGTPRGRSYTLEIFIQNCKLGYEMAVRPSRFRFRDRPTIPPVASLAAEFTFVVGVSGRVVTFDGSVSTGAIVDYRWDFGDAAFGVLPGQPTGGVTLKHTYLALTRYAVTLTVTDEGGRTASVTHMVSLEPGAIDGDFVNDRNAFSGAESS